MTNKEAIEIIEAYKDRLTSSCSNLLDEDICAFDLAIKALEFVNENYPKTFIDYLNGELI